MISKLVILLGVTLMFFHLTISSPRAGKPFLAPQKHTSDKREIPDIRGYDFSDRNAPQHSVVTNFGDGALRELSGLAFTDDGRLLGHGDETGMIYEIDYRTGTEKKHFRLGRLPVAQDFEGIAVKKDTVFLVTSRGVLIRCLEGANRERVSYQTFRTSLDARYNVEGLTYDPTTDCLLLACKGYPGKGYDKHKAVYAFSLRTYKLLPIPRFLLPLKTIARQSDHNEFNPSGIERHPLSGNFFVIAFNGYSIVEITPDGKVVGHSELLKSVHRQPEGIAIAADGTLVIANEGRGKEGTIVVHQPVQMR